MKQKTLYKQISFEGESEISRIFNTEYFSIGELLFSGKIIVAIIKFKSIESLNDNWKEINSYITGHYVSNVDDEFSKWNFYIFYISGEKIEKQLKYEIENNKFSSRKVVIDRYKKSLTKLNIADIISENITNDNIFISPKEVVIPPFQKNNKLSGVIDKIVFGKGKKDKDDILSKALDQIELKYKK